MTKQSRCAIIATAILGMLTFESCKKYDEGPGLSLRSKTARVDGEWEIKHVENYTTFTEEGKAKIEFNKNGEFEFNQMDDNYDVTFTGEWEFSSDKEEIRLSVNENGDIEDFQIIRLTNKEMVWEDKDGYRWELEAE